MAFLALSLDLDNTLIDRDAAARRWWEARLAPIGALSHLDEVMARDGSGQTPRGPFFAWAASALPALGGPEALWASFRAEIAAFVEPEPGVVERVRALRARVPVAILTDGGSAVQRAKLAAAGLEVDAVLVSEELGARKPHPACFRAVEKALGVPARQILHVGDHPDRDVRGAEQAGMRALWVSSPRHLLEVLC